MFSGCLNSNQNAFSQVRNVEITISVPAHTTAMYDRNLIVASKAVLWLLNARKVLLYDEMYEAPFGKCQAALGKKEQRICILQVVE